MSHKAKKSLGQNFLNDPEIIKEIVAAAELDREDTILEIGPGKGILTEALLAETKEVVAVEIDVDLLPELKDRFGMHENFTLVHMDALKYEPAKELIERPYKIVANIPYYITSPILNHFLLDQFANGQPPSLIVLMVQKEVAEKILAAPRNGHSKHSVLSLQVHLFGEPELVCTVPASAFTPQPKVDSAVIKIRVHPNPKIPAKTPEELKRLFWLFHMSFAQKRKKLTNNLANALQKSPTEIRELLEKLGINPDARAEELTLTDWNALYSSLRS